ncbi:MAG: Mfa1 family fimbria major subunit [Tannerella sp.]|jgi:hypothetical protein|nr:Mfa1 family fimbria major subunit [Tannerella sp.]
MNKINRMSKWMVASATLGLLTTACSTSEVIPEGGGTPSASKTGQVEFKISGGEPTRAIVDGSATAKELKINSITVFIFGSAGCEADTTWTLGANNSVAGVKNLAEGTTNTYVANFYGAPVGTKHIYVGLNLTSAMQTAIKTYGVGTSITISNDTLKTSNPNYYSDFADYDGGNGGGFPMFNVQDVTADILADGTTSVPVTVERWVAKVTMQTSADFDANTGDVRTAQGMTINPELKFEMAHANTTFYPIPKVLSSVTQDPNWEYSANYQSQFVNLYQASWDGVNKTFPLLLPNKNVGNSTSSPVSDTTYVFENTHQTKAVGQMTFAYVMATFQPAEITSWDGSTLSSTAYVSQAMDSLFVFNDGGTYRYFNDKTEAEGYAAASNLKFTTYYDGHCYYRVFLNPTKDNNVYRNDYYQVTINGINQLGYPGDDDTDPSTVIGATTMMTYDITVQPWAVIPQDATLGGDN